MFQDRVQQIRAKVAQCIATAETKFGIKLPHIDIRFDLKGRAAGMACKRDGVQYLRFNRELMMIDGGWNHIINNTVPHEVAHAVCQAFPQFGKNHNSGWTRVCCALGGNGQRAFSSEACGEDVTAYMKTRTRKQTKIKYITTSGAVTVVSATVHNRIQAGTSYTLRSDGSKLNRTCQYSYA